MHIGNKLLSVWFLTFLVTVICYQAVQSILTSAMLLLSGTVVLVLGFYRLGYGIYVDHWSRKKGGI